MYAPLALSKKAEIKAAIDQVQQSIGPDVIRINYEIGEDWTGQPAIFFRIVLTDDAAKHRLSEIGTQVMRGLHRLLDFAVLGVYPYRNFRSESEQAALREPAWA